MLWNVRVSWDKKLALMGIFSLTVFVIIVSIIRIAVVTSKTVQGDVTWLYMWGLIEMAVGMFFPRHKSMSTTTNAILQNPAVVVSCLVSFRQFFVKSVRAAGRPKHNILFTGNRGLLSRFRSQTSDDVFKMSKRWGASRPHLHGASSLGSSELIVPLNNIVVDRNLDPTFALTNEGSSAPYARDDNISHSTRSPSLRKESGFDSRQGAHDNV